MELMRANTFPLHESRETPSNILKSKMNGKTIKDGCGGGGRRGPIISKSNQGSVWQPPPSTHPSPHNHEGTSPNSPCPQTRCVPSASLVDTSIRVRGPPSDWSGDRIDMSDSDVGRRHPALTRKLKNQLTTNQWVHEISIS